MNNSRTDSRTDSVSAHVATHDRKGREGKGREIAHFIHDRYVPRARPTATRPAVAATAAMDGGETR